MVAPYAASLHQRGRQRATPVFIPDTRATERVNAELDRRAKMVGIFLQHRALLRLFTAVPQDHHDEWHEGRRHFSQCVACVLHPDGPALLTNPLTRGIRMAPERLHRSALRGLSGEQHWLPMRTRARMRPVSFHALRHTAATLALEELARDYATWEPGP
jgi:hypothetical protein